MDNTSVFRMAFASVYPHYITKAEKKGHTKEEVYAIIHWLAGYDEQTPQDTEEVSRRIGVVIVVSEVLTPGSSAIWKLWRHWSITGPENTHIGLHIVPLPIKKIREYLPSV
jgi:hypothetical protein